MQSRTPENSFNLLFSLALAKRHPDWKGMSAEQTGVVSGKAGKAPDIVLVNPRQSPVVIETEYYPAHTVEKDAQNRLREKLRRSTRAVENTIAVRIPEALKTIQQIHLEASIEEAVFSFCIFTANDDITNTRWPEAG